MRFLRCFMPLYMTIYEYIRILKMLKYNYIVILQP